MPAHFLDYAEKLADHDLPYQAVINNVTTNKQITLWYSDNPTNFLVNWRHTYESIKRMSAEQKSTSAPIILANYLATATASLQAILWLLMTTGLRVGSIKKAVNADYIRNSDGVSVNLYVRHIKYIPTDHDRNILITKCSCKWDGTLDNNCIVHGTRTLPDFKKLNWQQLEFELHRLGLTWHSTRRTLATYLKCAERDFGLVLDENKINTLFGWTTDSQMFNKYAAGWQGISLNQLPDLSRMLVYVTAQDEPPA